MPETDEAREVVFARWYQQAPKLLPLTGYRFIIGDPLDCSNPVLSVWGSDTIVYGWDLRSYLLNELGLLEQVYDEEKHEWDVQTIFELWLEVYSKKERVE
jgi:hypothetical protein